MFYSKFQEGMVPQVADPQQFQQQGEQIDPEMLSQIMSEYGYGQGVDFNGNPTPNVSGKPSFADMMQEIQQRYDAKILPLQKELEKLEEELKNNPGDQTLANKIERTQQKIDALEKQEDKELQQLEEEVEKSGQMIEAQKQNPELLAQNGEQIDPEMLQQVMQEQGIPQDMPQQQMPQEMPMMQTGGITKNQTGTVLDYVPFMSDEKKKELSNRAKVIFSAMKDETLNGNGGGNPSSTTRSIMRDKKDIEDKYPLLDLALQLNPVYSGIDIATHAKSDIENKNTASIPLWLAAGLIGFGGSALRGAIKGGRKWVPKSLRKLEGKELENALGHLESYKDLFLEDPKAAFNALKTRGTRTGAIAKGAAKGLLAPLKLAANVASSTLGNLGNIPVHYFKHWEKLPTLMPKGWILPKDFKKGNRILSWFDSWPNYHKTGEYFTPQTRLGRNIDRALNVSLGLATAGYPLYKGISTGIDLYNNKRAENEREEEQSTNSENIYENNNQTGGILNKYAGGGDVIEPVAEPTDEQKKKAEQLEKDRQVWFNSMLDQIKENHPQGIKGYLKDAPWTQHINMGNMIGKAIDNSGRMNIEAQHQFSHNYNPYTYVYDKALREYDDQQRAVKQRYALDDIHLKRYKPQPQYGSLQQAQNARLAQQSVDNINELQNKSNLLQSLQSVNSVFGKQANDAYQKMLEQEKANALLNENERKSYLSAIDSYNKEKMALNDNIVNYLTMAGNEWANNDEFYGEYAPNYLTGLKLGIPVQILNMILKRNSQYNANLAQSAQNTNNR